MWAKPFETCSPYSGHVEYPWQQMVSRNTSVRLNAGKRISGGVPFEIFRGRWEDRHPFPVLRMTVRQIPSREFQQD